MSQRKRKIRKANQAKAAAAQSGLGTLVHPDAAGIDVGGPRNSLAAVPPGRGEGPHIRTFSAFTEGLHALRDWLVACKIKTVAMESTRGRRHRSVPGQRATRQSRPGKKTDVVERRVAPATPPAGLLRGWFRPKADILPLRYLMRHRGDLIAQAGQQVQLMQKVMTEISCASITSSAT